MQDASDQRHARLFALLNETIETNVDETLDTRFSRGPRPRRATQRDYELVRQRALHSLRSRPH